MRIGTRLLLPETITPAGLCQEAADIAARGFDSVWTSQQPGGWDPLDILPALADGPGELGTAVVPTYPRHPLALATQALTAQALTGGKLTLGIGPSHALYIADQLGIPYTAPARHTRAYLEVLRPLLRGEHVRYSGEFFTVDSELVVQADPPPVLVAALGPRMLEVTRELADGTIAVWVRPGTVGNYLVPRLGENARVAVLVMVAVTPDPDGARERIARDYGIVNELPAYRAVLDRGGLSGPADTVLAGDETTVLDELRRFRDAGVTDLIVTPLGTPQEQSRVLDAVVTVS